MIQRPPLYILIIAALFGIMAWVSVNLREEYQVTVDAPLTVDNVPPGMAIRSALPHSIRLKFHGDGWRLAGLLLTHEPKLVFSASALPAGNRPFLFNDIAERVSLTPGVRLLDAVPDSLSVQLEPAIRKRVPVVLDCGASFREGYGQVGATSVTPDSVTLSGAESLLRTIDSWKTERSIFDNVRSPLDVQLPLAAAAPYAITFSPQSVHVVINVEPFAEKVFSGLPVDVLAVPGNREVILIPPKIEIVVRAGIRQLSTLTTADFHVSTGYDSIVADTTGAVDPDIAYPTGVQLVSKRPEHLQYIVRKRL